MTFPALPNKLNNVILIGMPGAGKSTVGIHLAKALSLSFLDTDVLIQSQQGNPLQAIIDTDGYMALRRIEEEVLLKLTLKKTLIATGGSAVYSDAAMQHLKFLGIIVFINVGLDTLQKRINNEESRGIIRQAGQSLSEIYTERKPLYHRYADIICNNEKNTNLEFLPQEILTAQKK